MKRRNLVLAGPAWLSAGLLGGTSARAAQAANVIKFGQSASLSGSLAGHGRDIRDGMLAAFAAASNADAAKGLRYELVALDDAGLKERCAKNVAALLDGGVSALVGLTSDAGAEACLPLLNASQTALLGTASGDMGLRSSAAGAAFHVRAGYDLEYKRIASYIQAFGMRRVAVVYQQDTSKANLDAMTQALVPLAITPVESIAIDPNAASYAAVGKRLLAASADLVLFATQAGPIAALIDQLQRAQYPGLFYASSCAGQELIDLLAANRQSCIMSLVVPRPNSGALSLMSRYRQDLAALGGELKTGMDSLEGYIIGRIAIEAARNALKLSGGEHLSRSRLKEAIAGLRTDLGGYKVAFAPGVTQGSQFVDLISIDRYGHLVG